MINTIWLTLIVLGVLTGVATGTSADVTKAAIESAKRSSEYMSRIHRHYDHVGAASMKSLTLQGLQRWLAKIFAPVASLLFPFKCLGSTLRLLQ